MDANFGSTVYATLGLPAKTVVCLAPEGLAVGFEGKPTIETSRDAVLVRNSVPAEVVTSGGTPGSPSTSLFQSGLISVKVRVWATWAVRPGSVSFVQSVNW
jgi:hypothetical protein